MKKALILILIVSVCLVGYYAWSFAGGDFTSGGAVIGDPVENVEISWTSGSVTVLYHDEDTVVLEETSDRPINGDDRMRWRTDGRTLIVEYNTPRFFSLFTPSKALTVTLPKGVTLKKAAIAATSAEISVPELTAEEIILESTSGDIKAAVTAPDVRGESTSGDVTLVLNGRADRIRMGSTSGKLDLRMEEAEKAELHTTSGGVSMEAGNVKQADIGSTSGDIAVRVKTFGKMKISATSGSVDAALSAAPGFTAKVDTTSGDFDSALPLEKNGDIRSCGDGKAELEIGTTSGDVRLAGLE